METSNMSRTESAEDMIRAADEAMLLVNSVLAPTHSLDKSNSSIPLQFQRDEETEEGDEEHQFDTARLVPNRLLGGDIPCSPDPRAKSLATQLNEKEKHDANGGEGGGKVTPLQMRSPPSSSSSSSSSFNSSSSSSSFSPSSPFSHLQPSVRTPAMDFKQHLGPPRSLSAASPPAPSISTLMESRRAHLIPSSSAPSQFDMGNDDENEENVGRRRGGRGSDAEIGFQRQLDELESCLNTLVMRFLSVKQHSKMDISQRALKEVNNFVLSSVKWTIDEASRFAFEKDQNTISSSDVTQAIRPLGSIITPLKQHHSEPSIVQRPIRMGLKSVSSPSVDVSRMLNAYTTGLDGTPKEITGMTSYFKVIDKAVSNLISDASSDQGWEKLGTKNDISVWKRANHSFALHYTKSVGVLPGTPQFITTCIVDHEQQLQWDPLLKEVQVIRRLDRQTELRYLNYQAKVCFLSRARDFCALSHYYGKSDGSFVVIAHSIEDEKCPPVSGRTRGEIISCGYVIKPIRNGTCSEVTSIMHLDLKPELPEFITNLLVEPISSTISFLRSYVLKKINLSVT